MASAAKAVPVGPSCSAQILDEPGPPDFHRRYRFPFVSMKEAGSMEPPSAGWHSSGAVDRSTNGPWGAVAVATEMHSLPIRGTSAA